MKTSLRDIGFSLLGAGASNLALLAQDAKDWHILAVQFGIGCAVLGLIAIFTHEVRRTL